MRLVVALAFGLALCGCASSLSGQTPASTGPAPSGVLSKKVVYIHAGHGWTADNLGTGAWNTQRGETNEIVEDLSNGDLLDDLAERLWRAGATVVPLRPIGRQEHEVVLDNDDPGVAFSGSWNDSSAGVFFGSAGDVPYRFANTAATETSVVRYRPTLPEAGRYPVYTWVVHGPNRVDQLYRVSHSGGTTELRIDHRRVGSGLVYLGSYWFEAGDSGFVEISNQSTTPGVVIADMIRFGNGMGDIDRGGGISGFPRSEEAGLYWVQWHVERSQGVPTSEYRASSSDGSATVSLAPRWAEYMNREQSGSLSDRVFLSYHTNAAGGTARGTVALFNGNNNPAAATPNQFELAFTLGAELTDDMVLQNGRFEHDWFDRGAGITLDRSDFEFGEISSLRINDEFDATIVEVAFHDNPTDAQLLRDPRVHDAVARSMVQGLVKYFGLVGGLASESFPPAEPGAPWAVGNGDGTVTVGWTVPPTGEVWGDAATGYRIETSRDGKAFDAGVSVAGGSTTSAVVSGLGSGARFFRVVAENGAGVSLPTKVIGATASSELARVLVVDGFDRLRRQQNVRRSFLGGTIDRVWPDRSNSFDYIANTGRALQLAQPGVAFDSADNDAVESGMIGLSGYDLVIWQTGEESTEDRTFSFAEQTLVASYVSTGGSLLAAGAEIGWDLDNLSNGEPFYNNTLATVYVADDANSYDVSGETGSIFDGLSFAFDDGALFFDANFPDVVAPLFNATVGLRYGTGSVAATVRPAITGLGNVVVFGFPLVTITTDHDRADVLDRVLGLVGLGAVCEPDLTTTNANPGDAGYSASDGVVDGADLSFYVEAWLALDVALADFTTVNTNPGDTGYGTPDGVVDGADLSYFVEVWLSASSAGCP